MPSNESEPMRWIVQPWFYEGEEWDDEPGTPHVIEAPTAEAAREAFPALEYSGLNGLSVMTPEEWKAKGGGDVLPGSDS